MEFNVINVVLNINIDNYVHTCKTLIHNVTPGDGCIVIDNVVSKKQCKFLTL